MNNWVKILDEDIILLTKAMLDKIEKELTRCYWNKYQKELISPFNNTSEHYSNDYLSIIAYNWDEHSELTFETEHMRVYWYKYSNRSVEVYFSNSNNHYETIAKTLLESINSIKRDFGEL